MDVLNGDLVVKGVLVSHASVATITSNLLSMHAISVYLFAIALLLFMCVILFMLHWRHQVVESRKKMLGNDLDSPTSPLTQNFSYHLKTYEELSAKDVSTDNLTASYRRYSQYDNNLSNEYEKNYDKYYVRKADLI